MAFVNVSICGCEVLQSMFPIPGSTELCRALRNPLFPPFLGSQCAPMLPPLNGFADCDHGDECGSKCQFRCKDGFRLNIPSETENKNYLRSCLPNGAWSGQTPECVRERCPDLTPPSDVIMTCSDTNKIGSNCTFACNQDSNLVGSRWRECTVTGTWSNSKYLFLY